MSMSEETRREIDQIREEIRSIGAALRQLREDLSGVDRIKTGPQGEIDLGAWDRAEGVREEIRVVVRKRDEVQGRLNDLLRPFRAARVVPALRESGGTVRELITEVRGILPSDSPAAPHLEEVLDQALAVEDEGTALGRVLDLFLFREVRGAVEQVLGVSLTNGNGG